MQDNGLRTYRPPLDQYTFSSDKIESATKRWVDGVAHGTVSRALLLTGPTGLGKTTLALAVAERVGASSRDIRQVNCADLRTLDDARDLIQSSLTFGPSHGDYRVLILDECHQMVQNAQQAFLTPIESLPKNIILIGCTTAPDMLLKTFSMRFYRIELEPYSVDQLVDILMNLPEPPEPSIAVVAAELAEGSPRQAIAHIERGISEQQIKEITEEKASAEDFLVALKKIRITSTMSDGFDATTYGYRVDVAFSVLSRLKPDQYNRFCDQVCHHLENIFLLQCKTKPMLSAAARKFAEQNLDIQHVQYLYSEIQKLPVQKTIGQLKSILMNWRFEVSS